MNTLLVLIDFSQSSLNAAQYALSWAFQLNIKKVVLYHSTAGESTGEEDIAKELEKISRRLVREDKIEITCIVNSDALDEGINALARQYQAFLVVMGITGRNKVGQKLIGSNVFQVSQTADVPVLVVPAKAKFKTIRNIALALPIIADLQSHTPRDDIKSFVKTLGATLMIVNVAGSKDRTPKPVLYAGLKDLFGLFDELNPSYHFLTDQNTASSIADFAKDNNAQLLISISGKHGFLQGMFKPSITKKLAYHSVVPLLIYRSGKE